MDPSSNCPQCGNPLPPEAPAGLCPGCLMALNLKPETVFSREESAVPPLPPEEIAPHFPQLEILEYLGRGGMGVVYKARQKSLDRLVALKLLAPERAGDPQFAARFEKEAHALAALNHPNIVTIHDHGQAGGFYFLLMEYVDGVTLRELLAKERVSAREALAIVPQICDALQFAHDHGIVHRDIKPENILLDRRGRVKVADFGLVKLAPFVAAPAADAEATAGLEAEFPPADFTTDAGKIVGTPRYMAPEQIDHPADVDHRADIYALGVVFYEMLTGEQPGGSIAPPSTKVRLDVRLDEIVLRALEKEPERRYQQASILKTEIETMATEPGAAEAPAGTSEHPRASLPDGPPRRALVSPGVATQIEWSALAMAVSSGLSLLLLLFIILALVVFSVLAGSAGLGAPSLLLTPLRGMLPMDALPEMGAPANFVFILILALVFLQIGICGFIFVSALRMRRLRGRGMAIAGAIVLVAASLLGLGSKADASVVLSLASAAAGVWALVVLLRSETREAFENAALDAVQSSSTGAKSSAGGGNARALVAAPAVGLMVASGITLLGAAAVVLFMLLRVFLLHLQPVPVSSVPVKPFFVLSFFGVWIVFSFPAFLTFLGAWRMRRLRGYGLAITAAILGIITPPGLLIGAVFGVWALIVLSRRDVHEAFLSEAGRPRGKGPVIAAGVVAGLVLVAILTPVGLFLLRKGSSPGLELVIPIPGPLRPGQITQRSLSSPVGGELFLDLETGRVFTFSGSSRPDSDVLRMNGIDVSVTFNGAAPRIVFLGCAVRPLGQSAWETAGNPDVVQPGWDQSLRQIYNELPAPAPGSRVIVEGALPQTFLVRTANGPVLAEFSSYILSTPRQLEMRYVLLPPAAPEASPEKVAFGPVIERLLTPIGSDPAQAGLDLASGEYHSPPPAIGRAIQLLADRENGEPFSDINSPGDERNEWLKTSGVDLLGGLAPDGHARIKYIGQPPHYESGWASFDSADPEKVVQTLQDSPFYAGAKPDMPSVYVNDLNPELESVRKASFILFRTHDGDAGIMQVLGESQKPPGVKIRYKLVQNVATTVSPVKLPASAASQPPEPPRDKAAKEQLAAADKELGVLRQKVAVGAAAQADYERASLARAVLAAELKNDPVEAAHLKLDLAEYDLAVAGKMLTAGRLTQDEYDLVKLARDLAARSQRLTENPSFGPMVERTLVGDPQLPPTFLSLHDGAMISAPEKPRAQSSEGLADWWRGSAADLLLFNRPDRHLIASLAEGGVKLADFPTDKWDSATAADVADALRKGSTLPTIVQGGIASHVLPEHAALPFTLAVESRRGEQGLLQITAFTENPRGVKLRYKLLQTAESLPKPVTGFIRTFGAYPLSANGAGLALTPSAGGRVSLTITKVEGTGREAISTPDFFKKPGWFAYVESPDRIWIFDGASQLDVVTSTGRYSAGDPSIQATCPDAVWDAVPESVRSSYRQTAANEKGRPDDEAGKIAPPPGKAASVTAIIAIAADGTVTVAGNPCSESEFDARLRELVQDGAAVVVRADKKAPFKRVAAVIEVCRKAGIASLGMSEPKPTDTSE